MEFKSSLGSVGAEKWYGQMVLWEGECGHDVEATLNEEPLGIKEIS